MKFKYSPGLFGYGAKGADGSAGLSGLMLYFTDYDTTNDILIIKAAIQNNEDLWISTEPGVQLPGGRTYNVGDLFVNSGGRVFEITNTTTGDYIQTSGKLDTDTLFDTEDTITNDYIRYYNIYDQSANSNFIVDDVHSMSDVNYLASPTGIYGIAPRNFTRVQYVDVNNSSLNAFTLFSSAELPSESSRAFGIVREINSNLFRIGNINENGVIRGTELVFDVSSLKRYVSNLKSENLQSFLLNENEILRNDIINANKLFEGVFNTQPSSFTVISTDTDTIEISWSTAGFVQDASNVNAEIYFYDASTNNSFNPLIFHSADVSGTIEITDLTQDNLYGCFIKLFTTGWGRRSIERIIPCDGFEKILYVINPSSKTLDAATDGTIDGSTGYVVDFSTNSLTGWSTTSSSWITCTPTSAVTYTSTETFDVSVSNMGLSKPRNGFIDIFSQAPTERITISQGSISPVPSTIYVDFNNDGSLNTGILGSNIIDISVLMYAYADTSSATDNIVSSTLRYFLNSSNINTAQAISTISAGIASGPDTDTFEISIKNVQSSTKINFTSLLSSDILPSGSEIVDASTKAVVTNVHKVSGLDTIDSSWNAWYSHLNGIQQNYRGSE